MAVKIIESTGPTRVRQFSIFMTNQAGRLLDMVRLFGQHNIHIVAMSAVDTADFVVLRAVVDDPDRAHAIFEEHNLPFTECNLVVVELPSSAADLQKVLTALLQAECNIHYVYSFLTRPRGKAALAFHVDDEEVAIGVLLQNQFKLLTQQDISR